MHKSLIVLSACLFSTFLSFSRIKDYAPFVIEELDRTIYEGVFTGNGLLGTMTYLQSDSVIKISMGRTDVYDHRKEDMPGLYKNARLPVGYFTVTLSSAIKSATGVISFRDADAVAAIYTEQGVLRIKTITLSQEDYILIEVDKSVFNGSYTIQYIPELSRSPRWDDKNREHPENYQPNPKAFIGESQNIHYADQKMLAGGGYATAFRVFNEKDRELIVSTITYSRDNQQYLDEALARIAAFKTGELVQMITVHRTWWENYMGISEYNIPDMVLQRFYDMQMYKLACATRPDKPAIDLQGPWTGASTPWPGYWFNLNIQLTYSPLYTANRLSIAESLIQLINNNTENMKENILSEYRHDSYAVGRAGNGELITGKIGLRRGDTILLSGGAAELSNLTWMMLYYYQHYRYSMDISLKDPLYRILKGSVNYALHFIDKNKEGKYEFVVRTHSPEYPADIDFNTNYDLSSLRWGIKTLLELGEGDIDEMEYLRNIGDVLDNLIDYPQDENGYMISSNQAYERSHRHYSHLMMIYPYYLVNADQPGNINLIKKSVAYWQSKPEALQGYSLSGAGSIYAMLGDGDVALDYFKQLNSQFIQPNTLYKESGPVIETPLALAASLQEMSLQFWNGIVRVFPAIPSSWKNVSFRNFRTDGAFLISAEKKDGITTKIEIFSEYGGTIKLLTDEVLHNVDIKGNGKVISRKGRLYEISLPKGTKAVLYNSFLSVPVSISNHGQGTNKGYTLSQSSVVNESVNFHNN